MTHYKHLITAFSYAKLCGVRPIAIKERIQKGQLAAHLIGGIYFINVEQNPPCKNIRMKNKVSQPTPIANPNMSIPPNSANLMNVRDYIQKLQVRGYDIYEKMLRGEVEFVAVGDVIFIDTKKYPLELFLKTKQKRRTHYQVMEDRRKGLK